MNVNVIYDTDSGATKGIASRIADRLHARTIDIEAATRADFEDCDLLILGSPTYGMDALPDGWREKLDMLKSADLSGKKVALFGTGDQESFPDTYVDAMGILYDALKEKNAIIVGGTDTTGYEFSASLGQRDGKFVGLALDEEKQPEKTQKRIESWVRQLM